MLRLDVFGCDVVRIFLWIVLWFVVIFLNFFFGVVLFCLGEWLVVWMILMRL